MPDGLAFLGLTGGLGIDMPALVAFLVYGVVYLITPALSRSRERPWPMAAALYLLVLYAVLTLLQLLVQWYQMLNGPGVFNPGMQRGTVFTHVLFILAVFKLMTLTASMLAFAAGVHSVRYNQHEDPQTMDKVVDSLRMLREENLRLQKRLDRTEEPR